MTLAVSYVLGTTAGGTGRHVAMLARGCRQAGIIVSAFGPAAVGELFTDGAGTTAAPASAAGGEAGDGGKAAGGTAGAGEAGGGFAVVEIADRPRPGRDIAAVIRLRGLLAGARPDVVHAHGLRAGAVAAAALALRRPWRRRAALIVTVHNGPPSATASRMVYAVLERVVARRSAMVLCVSADLADRMRRLGARRTSLAVVPAPPAGPLPDGAAARVLASLDAAGQPVVLAVGRLAEQKGFDTLLAAAVRWQDRRPLPLLVIAGDGPLGGPLASRAASDGTCVRFLGQRADVPALLAAADVLAAPSRWEGQPLLLQEALRAGTPIVASRVGGIPDLTGADAALLVPPGDPGALATAVLRVLDDEELAGRLRAAGQARAAGLPSEAAAVEAAVALYRAAAATGAQAALR